VATSPRLVGAISAPCRSEVEAVRAEEQGSGVAPADRVLAVRPAIEYRSGARELYDLAGDPNELH
jgi:hypothetical protein